MNTGLYTIATAMTARHQAQETISKNIAGAAILGFRRQEHNYLGFGAELYRAQFRSLETQPTGTLIQPAKFDFNVGPSKTTSSELDFTIMGEGFFVLAEENQKLLTRNGNFFRDKNNLLVTALGQPVLGVNGPITLPPGEVTLKGDGSILVNETLVDRLLIQQPARYELLSSEGGGLFRLPPDAELIPGNAVLNNHMLEQSNVNLPQEMILLIENSRIGEMAGKGMQAVDEGIGRAIQDLLG